MYFSFLLQPLKGETKVNGSKEEVTVCEEGNVQRETETDGHRLWGGTPESQMQAGGVRGRWQGSSGVGVLSFRKRGREEESRLGSEGSVVSRWW